jgi:hypothetical protein
MFRKVICFIFGHSPKWRRLNGVVVEACGRCGRVYQMGDYRDLDSM